MAIMPTGILPDLSWGSSEGLLGGLPSWLQSVPASAAFASPRPPFGFDDRWRSTNEAISAGIFDPRGANSMTPMEPAAVNVPRDPMLAPYLAYVTQRRSASPIPTSPTTAPTMSMPVGAPRI